MLGGVLTFAELLARARACGRVGPGGTPTRRGASAAGRAGCGTGCSRSSTWPTDDPPVRRLRPAPGRRDRARGERRDRQDVHDRRAGGALRRGGHAARRAPARHLHPDGDRRAARARARAPRQRRAGAGGGATDERDEVVRLLADGTPEEVRLRRDRLARALADFDAATIATTHGFCQEVLGGLGVAGDVERDSEFVEDVTDLRRRGRRRPLRPPLLPPRRGGRVQPRGGGPDRVDRGRQPRRADRAGRRRRDHRAGDARGGSRSRSATSSSAASGAPA